MSEFASKQKQAPESSSNTKSNESSSLDQSLALNDLGASFNTLQSLQQKADQSIKGKQLVQLQKTVNQAKKQSFKGDKTRPEDQIKKEALQLAKQNQEQQKLTTQLQNKTPINDDPSLEKEADIMGAKALKVGGSFKPTVQKKTNDKTVQRKLIIPDASGTLKRYDNKKHGKDQVANAVSNINDQEGWEQYLFASEDFIWNSDDNQWVKSTETDVEDADQGTLESTQMLKDAAKKAAIGGAAGGLVGGVIGTVAGDDIGATTGGLVGGLIGGVAGGAMGLNVPAYAQSLLSEKLWKMGIIAKNVNVNIGYFDIAKFIAGSEVTIEPELSNITKFMENAGSHVKLDNLHAHIKMLWKSALDVQFEIPQFVANVSINLADPESGTLTIEANGTITIEGMNVELTSLNSTIPALLKGLLIKRDIKKEDIIEAFKASMHCDNITGAVSIKTHAFRGKRGKDLNEDEFDAHFVMDDLNLENSKGDKANTSGNVSNFDAEMNRTGGNKGASAKIHGHGAFSDMASLNDMLKKMEVDVSGFRVYGVAGLAKGKLLESIDKATAENPDASLSSAVLNVITKNSSALNADKILEGVRAEHPGSDNTKEQVKACCVYLIKKNKIKVSNPKLASLPGAKKTYAKKEPVTIQEEVDAIGSKKGKLLSGVGSLLTKNKGVEINMKGQSKEGPGQTKASSEFQINADKELVEKAYKMLELAHTVFSLV